MYELIDPEPEYEVVVEMEEVGELLNPLEDAGRAHAGKFEALGCSKSRTRQQEFQRSHFYDMEMGVLVWTRGTTGMVKRDKKGVNLPSPRCPNCDVPVYRREYCHDVGECEDCGLPVKRILWCDSCREYECQHCWDKKNERRQGQQGGGGQQRQRRWL